MRACHGRAHGTYRYFITPHGWKLDRLFSRPEARVFRPFSTPVGRGLERVDAPLDELICERVNGVARFVLRIRWFQVL